VKGDLSTLLLKLLEIDSADPKNPTPKIDSSDESFRIRINWRIRSTDIALDCYPPGAWAPDEHMPLLDDLSEIWLLRVSTDVRVQDMIRANESLDVTAPALFLRLFAENHVFCVMESGRAPGRVDFVVDTRNPAGTQILIATGRDGHTDYSNMWARAINSGIITNGKKDLNAFDVYTEVDPFVNSEEISSITAQKDLAKLRVSLSALSRDV
jgi:hypothetical protein